LEAAEIAKTGKKIYPFHLGDIDIKTPKVVIDACKKALDEGKTGYCPAQGIIPLREALATYVSSGRNVTYTKDNVTIQPGGKPVIMKFLLTLMEEGDEVLYPTPGYPIYESLINYIGGVPKPYRYFEDGNQFKLDMADIKKQITNKTKILILNNYHNPTGYACTDEELQEISNICVQKNLWVLSDEAYFDLVFKPMKAKSIVSYPGMKDRTVILFTYSKTWSMTGWRLGAAIGPTELIAAMTKLNTNDEACTTHFVQYAGIVAVTHPEAKQFGQELLTTLEKRRAIVVPGLNKIPGFKAFMPQSTFYVFVNVTEAMKKKGVSNVVEFRKLALRETGVSFCTRTDFGKPQPNENQFYVRFAFSGIDEQNITEALSVLEKWMSS